MVGYYKLRNADLIAAISKHGGGVMDLLDTPVPENDKHPNLTPNKYIPAAKQSRLNKSIFNDLEKHKVRSKINSFADWIVSFIPKPEQKLAINQKLESLKSYVKRLFKKYVQRSSKFERLRRILKDLLNNTRSMELAESIPYRFLTPFDHMYSIFCLKIVRRRLIWFLHALWSPWTLKPEKKTPQTFHSSRRLKLF